MAEYANMRFRLVWAIAVMLPINRDNTASKISIGCQSPRSGSKVLTNKRNNKAKAASLGAAAIIKVTAVGAP